MPYKDFRDFIKNSGNLYSNNGEIIDDEYNSFRISYPIGDGDYHTNDGKLYHNR